MSTRNYDNNEGKKVYVTEVVANNVRFLEKAEGSQQRDNTPPPLDNDMPPVDPDDLPF